MENSKMVKNILAKIEANKEILATMPQNTQKTGKDIFLGYKSY